MRQETGKVPTKPAARTRGTGSIKRERQLAAPWRELTAEALRWSVAARAKPPSRLRQGRGAALQACRPPAYGKGGELRSRHAALPPSARAGSCAPGMPPSRLRQGRKRPSETSAADVRYRPVQARASARRSKARIDSGGTPRLEIRKCTSERKTQCLCGFRHLHTCTSEEGMYK